MKQIRVLTNCIVRWLCKRVSEVLYFGGKSEVFNSLEVLGMARDKIYLEPFYFNRVLYGVR